MKSILRRPNFTNPLEPFSSNDLPGCLKVISGGFDLHFVDENGLNCLMHASSRGYGSVVHLSLSRARDPKSLAVAKSKQGLDAFDMAASCGSTICMNLISKYLPDNYLSSRNQNFLSHACEAFKTEPHLAYAWLVDLTLRIHDVSILQEAHKMAMNCHWEQGIQRLEVTLSRQKAQYL